MLAFASFKIEVFTLSFGLSLVLARPVVSALALTVRKAILCIRAFFKDSCECAYSRCT